MTGTILTINLGSSSLKAALFRTGEPALAAPLLRASVSNLHGEPAFSAHSRSADHSDTARQHLLPHVGDTRDLVAAMADLAETLLPDERLVGVGHRIVHGGLTHDGPCRAEPAILDHLDTLSPLAPAHQPFNLAGIRALMQARPGLPQSLSFDTAFHRTVPPVAQAYALPRELSAQGIVRFGFHGLSYAHIAQEAPRRLAGRAHRRLLAAHLGSGASACAILDGHSVATSMGLTALDGLPMATRCGDLDPGVVLHLIGDRGLEPAAVSDLLYHRSGLLGLSGISGDVRVLEASEAPQAREALEVFAYRIARELASLTVALGGLDALVFSGGVGENSAGVRALVCRHLAHLGVVLSPQDNAAGKGRIEAAGAPVAIAIIAADEESVIARETARILGL